MDYWAEQVDALERDIREVGYQLQLIPGWLSDWLDAQYRTFMEEPERATLLDTLAMMRAYHDLAQGISAALVANNVAHHIDRMSRAVASVDY